MSKLNISNSPPAKRHRPVTPGPQPQATHSFVFAPVCRKEFLQVLADKNYDSVTDLAAAYIKDNFDVLLRAWLPQ